MSDYKKVAFRSSLGGFNREDVNKYILTLSRDFGEKEAELTARAAAAEAAAEEARTEADALRADLAAAKASSAEAAAEIETQKAEIAALKAQLADTAEEAASLRRDLQARPAAPTADKSEKYDQISAQIGDIMISASTSADAIVAAANEQAAKIMSETEDEANYIRSRLSDAADEMLSRISGELHVSTENCLGELLTALREMRENADSMIRDFEKRSRDLGIKVEYYQSAVSDTVEAVLKEMDDKYGIRSAK